MPTFGGKDVVTYSCLSLSTVETILAHCLGDVEIFFTNLSCRGEKGRTREAEGRQWRQQARRGREEGGNRKTKGDRGRQRATKGDEGDSKGRHREPVVLCTEALCLCRARVLYMC